MTLYVFLCLSSENITDDQKKGIINIASPASIMTGSIWGSFTGSFFDSSPKTIRTQGLFSK